MKRFATLLAIGLALSIGATAAHAAAKNPDKAAAKAAKKGDGAKGLTGTVSKVDGNNIVIQTRGKAAAEVTITTDANTKFEGTATSLADIKPGMHVSAAAGNGTASKVTVGAGREKGAAKAGNKKAGAKPAKNKAA